MEFLFQVSASAILQLRVFLREYARNPLTRIGGSASISSSMKYHYWTATTSTNWRPSPGRSRTVKSPSEGYNSFYRATSCSSHLSARQANGNSFSKPNVGRPSLVEYTNSKRCIGRRTNDLSRYYARFVWECELEERPRLMLTRVRPMIVKNWFRSIIRMNSISDAPTPRRKFSSKV